MTKKPTWLNRYRSISFFVVTLSFTVPIMAFISPVYGQQEKVVERLKGFSYVPIDVVEVKTADRIVSLGEPFNADREWLKGISFKLKNNFDREITYIQIGLIFPEIPTTGIGVAFPMHQGKNPYWDEVHNQRVQPISVKPGEEITFTVDESQYRSLVKVVENKQPVSSINKVLIEIRFVVFTDNMGWRSGDFLRQDPSDSMRWKTVSLYPPAKQPEKVFERYRTFRPEPVEVIEMKSADKSVSFGEKFAADDDWLKGATFRLKNNFDREIVYLNLYLSFPETLATGIGMLFTINQGRHPSTQGEYIKNVPPLSLKPGEEITFVLDEARYLNLIKFIETRQSISTINRVKVSIGFIGFADGLGWSTGEFMRQDPANPRRWVPVDSIPPK
ncbi:MAG: hypothetical protein AB1757_10080 [Acidobacteriota bacterium]